MSWFKLPKDNSNSLFNRLLKKYYASIRITKEQSMRIPPDVDEENDYDTDLIKEGAIPIVEMEKERTAKTTRIKDPNKKIGL
jgi:hypothetical protein